LCKDLERGEVKKWLKQILEILMAERGKEERTEQVKTLVLVVNNKYLRNQINPKTHKTSILFSRFPS
jgi:hypothetical protein